MVIARAIATDPSTVLSAELESDETGTTNSKAVMQYGSFLGGYPTAGSDFGMISTGLTDSANDPNNSGSTGFVLHNGFDEFGMLTNEGNDLAGFTMEMTIPEGTGTPCFSVDVKFSSEEFPEFVGSSFNDFAVGRINDVEPPTVDDELQPVAPGNFLRDGIGRPITVNNNYNVSAGRAGNTTYDGATPTLRARAAVEDGETFTFTTYIADVGDSIYDSTLFLDRASIARTNNCVEGTFGPSQTKFKVGKKKGNANVAGTVSPPHPGKNSKVILFKEKGKKFKKLATKNAKLGPAILVEGKDPVSKFKTSFKLPDKGTCRISASFAGDADTFPSSSKKTFKC